MGERNKYPERRILIANDEFIIGVGIKTNLERNLGCIIDRVISVDAAIKKLGEGHYDVLVSDQNFGRGKETEGRRLVIEAKRLYGDTIFTILASQVGGENVKVPEDVRYMPNGPEKTAALKKLYAKEFSKPKPVGADYVLDSSVSEAGLIEVITDFFEGGLDLGSIRER